MQSIERDTRELRSVVGWAFWYIYFHVFHYVTHMAIKKMNFVHTAHVVCFFLLNKYYQKASFT